MLVNRRPMRRRAGPSRFSNQQLPPNPISGPINSGPNMNGPRPISPIGPTNLPPGLSGPISPPSMELPPSSNPINVAGPPLMPPVMGGPISPTGPLNKPPISGPINSSRPGMGNLPPNPIRGPMRLSGPTNLPKKKKLAGPSMVSM